MHSDDRLTMRCSVRSISTVPIDMMKDIGGWIQEVKRTESLAENYSECRGEGFWRALPISGPE
jgi:hypothetical protein